MRRYRCFVFDLPLSLRSSRPSKPKRKIRLYYMYVSVPPQMPQEAFSAAMTRQRYGFSTIIQIILLEKMAYHTDFCKILCKAGISSSQNNADGLALFACSGNVSNLFLIGRNAHLLSTTGHPCIDMSRLFMFALGLCTRRIHAHENPVCRASEVVKQRGQFAPESLILLGALLAYLMKKL